MLWFFLKICTFFYFAQRFEQVNRGKPRGLQVPVKLATEGGDGHVLADPTHWGLAAQRPEKDHCFLESLSSFAVK